MTVDWLNEIDLSYTPPFSSPWDPVQTSAQAWVLARGKARSQHDPVKFSESVGHLS